MMLRSGFKYNECNDDDDDGKCRGEMCYDCECEDMTTKWRSDFNKPLCCGCYGIAVEYKTEDETYST